MTLKLRFNSIVLLVLAGLFVFATLNLHRLRVPAFGLDPCDAVMHFAVFTMLFALLSSLRAWLPKQGLDYSPQETYVLRSQQAVALAAFIAFVAHVVVLAKHPSMWISASSRDQLLGWLGAFAAIPVVMELLVLLAQPTPAGVESPHRNSTVVACLLALAILVFSPEYGFDNSSETTHILTVIVGGLVVFVPIGYLLPVLVPYQAGEQVGGKMFFNTASETAALLIGILMGTVPFWVSGHRAGSARTLLSLSNLMGPVVGLLIAYSFLAEQLGLTSNKRVNRGQVATISRGNRVD